MKHKKKILFFALSIPLLLALFALLAIMFIPRGYDKLRERPGTVEIPAALKESVIKGTESMTAEEISSYCSDITCDLLSFSFKQDVLFENEVSRAHCVTYARLHSSLCNIAFKAHDIDAEAVPIVCHMYVCGLNINTIIVSMLPQEYRRFFIDHDMVEIRKKSDKRTILATDPTEHDLSSFERNY